MKPTDHHVRYLITILSSIVMLMLVYPVICTAQADFHTGETDQKTALALLHAFEAGRQECIQNPASCGLTRDRQETCPGATLSSDLQRLYIPVIHFSTPEGTLPYWLELSYAPEKGGLAFEYVDSGKIEDDYSRFFGSYRTMQNIGECFWNSQLTFGNDEHEKHDPNYVLLPSQGSEATYQIHEGDIPALTRTVSIEDDHTIVVETFMPQDDDPASSQTIIFADEYDNFNMTGTVNDPDVLKYCYSVDSTTKGIKWEERSFYLPMSDGVNIAVDVVLPNGYVNGQNVPAVLSMTRYQRLQNGEYNTRQGEFFTDNGYAYVMVDARGSGASFGNRPYPWHQREIDDYGEVVQWITEQEWSNGRVGAEGISYDGNTALMLASTRHPAVKAVIPRFIDFDVYQHVAYPGGVFNEGFMSQWSEENNTSDASAGVKPVQGDTDLSMLKAALADHGANGDVYQITSALEYNSSFLPGHAVTMEDLSPYAHRDDIEQSNAAIYTWASWMDGGTASGAISLFNSFSNPQTVIIGPFSHGAGYHADPFFEPETPVSPSIEEQNRLMLTFLDNFLKEEGTGKVERQVSYYTLGENVWKVSDVWPPKGFEPRTWYFAEDGTLTDTIAQDPDGSDLYIADMTATTGEHTKWHTQLDGGDVIYPDRQQEDDKLLTYTTSPLGSSLEITGTPVVDIQFASTETDGAFFVYLEDVAPDGKVTLISEGIMRLTHRNISSDLPPYYISGPFHTFKEKHAKSLVPGEMDRMSMALSPTSVLIKKGHSIRIAIAGHDASVFKRYPETGSPQYTISRNSVRPSFIELPVKIREKK